MSKQQELTSRLQQAFLPHFVLVENESHLHHSGRGSESHFKIVLVSNQFVGVAKVARHRLVYQLFAEDLKNGLHALALHLYTQEEWETQGEQIPVSTNCAGIGH